MGADSQQDSTGVEIRSPAQEMLKALGPFSGSGEGSVAGHCLLVPAGLSGREWEFASGELLKHLSSKQQCWVPTMCLNLGSGRRPHFAKGALSKVCRVGRPVNWSFKMMCFLQGGVGTGILGDRVSSEWKWMSYQLSDVKRSVLILASDRLESEFQFCHFWAIWTQASFWAFLSLCFHI